MENLIGYIPIEYFSSATPKVCEAPKHVGMLLPAYAALAIKGPAYPDGLVQMICKECWQHFDDDMNHPNWNLLER